MFLLLGCQRVTSDTKRGSGISWKRRGWVEDDLLFDVPLSLGIQERGRDGGYDDSASSVERAGETRTRRGNDVILLPNLL